MSKISHWIAASAAMTFTVAIAHYPLGRGLY